MSSMESIKYLLFFLVLSMSFHQCRTTKIIQPTSGSDDLIQIMSGSFSSIEQSIQDSSYYNISLHMYPIWTANEKQYLYVEQALFEKQESPYRQRVYELNQLADGIVESKVYKLKNEADFINKWSETSFFDEYDDSILEERKGCSVFLKKIANNQYEGSTDGKSCLSTMRGASYASSVVSIKPSIISSWDQGFNSEDNQVWGATEGPYVFKKLN